VWGVIEQYIEPEQDEIWGVIEGVEVRPSSSQYANEGDEEIVFETYVLLGEEIRAWELTFKLSKNKRSKWQKFLALVQKHLGTRDLRHVFNKPLKLRRYEEEIQFRDGRTATMSFWYPVAVFSPDDLEVPEEIRQIVEQEVSQVSSQNGGGEAPPWDNTSNDVYLKIAETAAGHVWTEALPKVLALPEIINNNRLLAEVAAPGFEKKLVDMGLIDITPGGVIVLTEKAAKGG